MGDRSFAVTPPDSPALPQRVTRSQPSRPSRSSHASGVSGLATPTREAAVVGEVIETHFLYNNGLYFVVCNTATGAAKVTTRQRCAPIEYAVKPLWYMAGTPALRQYYRMNATDAAMASAQTTLVTTTHGAVTMTKRIRPVVSHRCVIQAFPDDPKALKEQTEYSLRIPWDWAQLAHCRLFNCNIHRVVACASKPESANEELSVTVYVVKWQNESSHYELLPASLLEKFSKHDHHHQMTLDLWEEACVQDLRWLRSAATVDYSHQSTADKTNEYDDFWVKCIHTFHGRTYWTDENGYTSRAARKLYVHKWIGWPMSTCRISTEGAKSEVEEDEVDPNGFDEYVQFAIYDKFAVPQKTDDDSNITFKKAEHLNYKTFTNNCGSDSHTAHVPPAWRSMAEKHAEQNDNVNILAVFRYTSVANLYIVQWPSYDHITLVPSLTLRKRHCRFMLKFFEQNAYLPKLELFTSE